MRLTILFATALVTSSTVFASGDSQGPPGIQKRQGIVDTIQNGINDAIQNAQDLFNIGHAGEESSDNAGNDNNNDGAGNNDETTPTTPAADTTKSTTSSSKTTSSSSSSTSTSKDNTPDASDDNSDADSKTTKTSSTTTKAADTTTDSGDDNTDDNSEPQPTGDSCPTDGEKKCDGSGSSSYSLCQDGNWISQKCGGSDICGTDSTGAIACINKDATVVQLESCSKKKQQRCSASDPTKYQTCDGKYWQNYGCDDGKLCSLKDNKAVCGDAGGTDTGGSAYDPNSYSQISQVAFVPQSDAGRSAPLVASLLALAVGAALYM